MARFVVRSPVLAGGKIIKPAADGSATVELSQADAKALLALGAVEPAPAAKAPAAPPAPPAPPRKTKGKATATPPAPPADGAGEGSDTPDGDAQ